MKRNMRWFGILLGLAVMLGVFTASAQNRPQGQRVPAPRPARDLHGVGDRQLPGAEVRQPRGVDDRERSRPAGRVTEMPSPQQGLVRVAAQSSRDVRDWNTWATRMERRGNLRLRRVQEDTVLPGRWHERYDQFYKGFPVFGGDIVRQTDGKVVLSIFGTVYTGIDLDVTPTLSPEQAIKAFEDRFQVSASPRLAPQLVILPRDDGLFVLTYRMRQFVGPRLPVLFINAEDGTPELEYNDLQTQEPAIGWGHGVLGDEKKVSAAFQTGQYLAWDLMRPSSIITLDLRGNYVRADRLVNGWTPVLWSDVASSTNSSWDDPVVVDGHGYLGWTYDYYFRRHSRKGLDGNDGRQILAIVHPIHRHDISLYTLLNYELFIDNAFFCHQCGYNGEDLMMFSEGFGFSYYGQYVDYAVAAIDEVAHEYSHGVTRYSSELTPRAESGALSESFSDVMATGVEFFYQPPGSGLMDADYLSSEDSWRATQPGVISGIRSIADPRAFGDPDHYSVRKVGPIDEDHDYGYVHSNSLIPSHAFYLAIEGGTNRTSGLFVQGVGGSNREQIERAFYRAFVNYLTKNANFSAARAATIRAAQELYGVGSPADRAVTQAWTAVGVF